ncbi:hypothetical protein N9N45_04475 [Planktomarina temperata]|nr:hypothetical protein [Planktomarina temperata]
MTGKNTAKISKIKHLLRVRPFVPPKTPKKPNPQDVKGCPIAQKLDLQL